MKLFLNVKNIFFSVCFENLNYYETSKMLFSSLEENVGKDFYFSLPYYPKGNCLVTED